METDNFNQEAPQVESVNSLHQVTPLSKYLAMALFVILPFVGGYIGYQLAPEKVVEIEKEVIREVVQEVEVEKEIRSDIKGELDHLRKFRMHISDILFNGIERTSREADSTQWYIWSGGKIYSISFMYGAYITWLEDISENEVNNVSVISREVSSNQGSYKSTVQLLISENDVYHAGGQLDEIEASQMVFDHTHGFIYDNDSAYGIFLKCNGYVVSEVEYTWMVENQERVIEGC